MPMHRIQPPGEGPLNHSAIAASLAAMAEEETQLLAQLHTVQDRAETLQIGRASCRERV